MAGEGMTQHVRVQVLAEFADTGLAHPQLYRARPEAAPLLADEYRAIGRFGQRPQRQPLLQRPAGHASDR
ncbi:hypothetical protein D3C84_1193010 [compost metagenome]